MSHPRAKKGRRPQAVRPPRSEPRRSGIVLARTVDDAVEKATLRHDAKSVTKKYRGPVVETGIGRNGTIVTWTDGKFTVKFTTIAAAKKYARMPKGLAERVNEALERGDLNG